MEQFKMIIVAAFFMAGVFTMASGVYGMFRYKYVLNRMHTAAAIDTLGLILIMCGLIIWQGIDISSLKIVLIIMFFWISGPVSSHLIARMEVSTNETLAEECEVKELGKH